MRFLGVLTVLYALVLPAVALDREAFTFTDYQLTVRVEPEQQRLGVRGTVTLRNDSTSPQKDIALQISSTLDWSSIKLKGKPVEFVGHEYTSDIDHTGALSEAIVTLPNDLPPKGTVVLEVGYEGVVPLDTTRLTQIGVPEDKAKHADWDQISKSFTAVRGIGYVAWYPVAVEEASLSEGDSVPEAVARWKSRHADTTMHLLFESTSRTPMPVSFSSSPNLAAGNSKSDIAKVADFRVTRMGISVPTFVIADYQKLTQDLVTVHYLAGQEEAAKNYAETAAQIDPVIPRGPSSTSLHIFGLADPDASSFVTEGMLLTPLKSSMTNEAELSMVYAEALQRVVSSRAWVRDGLAHYAQAAFIEAQHGRQEALDYLNSHRAALVEGEKPKPSAVSGDAGGNWETVHSLINAPDDLYLQTKAMAVWWMLRDMLENPSLGVLPEYHADEDKDAAYVEHLIEKNNPRDLGWFFEDWVYHDRGLPDFRVDSVFSSQIPSGGFLVTITIANLGGAGAETPVTLQFEGGEIRRRLEVRAKSKATLRVEAAGKPSEVTVNDGSVPESDMTNNTYKIENPTH
ncbi:MAG: hypothetical protein WB952_21580 [Terriglobales bacterium]